MKKIFSKLKSFLMESNHYKHLIGGFLVGIIGLNAWTALFASVVAASCLEYKDAAHGDKWDWKDWACTVVGGCIAMLFWAVM